MPQLRREFGVFLASLKFKASCKQIKFSGSSVLSGISANAAYQERGGSHPRIDAGRLRM